jgi:DNA primase
VVASCGTALTADQVRAVKRHTGKMVVNFDPDAAGEKAAEGKLPILLEEGLQVRIVELDGGLDPDEYCKDRGAEAYRARDWTGPRGISIGWRTARGRNTICGLRKARWRC